MQLGQIILTEESVMQQCNISHIFFIKNARGDVGIIETQRRRRK
jgi:hypothetical protein